MTQEEEGVRVLAVRATSVPPDAGDPGVEVAILVLESDGRSRWVTLGVIGEGGGNSEWLSSHIRAAWDRAAKRGDATRAKPAPAARRPKR